MSKITINPTQAQIYKKIYEKDPDIAQDYVSNIAKSYKAKERYAMGWSDLRGVFNVGHPEDKPLDRIPESIKALSIKMCRDLWEVRLGDLPVEVETLRTLNSDDPLWGIFNKLLRADELIYEVVNMPNRVGRVETYRLKAEHGDH